MNLEQVKKRFARKGITFIGWAKENNLNYRTVIAVVNGVNKGRSGEAHRVAVALGLKNSEEIAK